MKAIMLITVVDDQELPPMVALLRRARSERGGAEATRIWSFNVDEVA